MYGVSNSDGENKGKVVLLEFLSVGSKLIWDYVGRVRRVTVGERKRWLIIGRTAMPMNMIFRLEAALDNHIHLESKSFMVAATPLWLLVEVLNLVRTLVAFELGWKSETVYASAIVLLRDDRDRD